MIRWLVFVFGFVFKKDPPSALTQRPITHGVEGAPTPTTATVGGGGGSDGSWFNVLPQHAGALSDVEPPLPVSGDEGGGLSPDWIPATAATLSHLRDTYLKFNRTGVTTCQCLIVFENASWTLSWCSSSTPYQD